MLEDSAYNLRAVAPRSPPKTKQLRARPRLSQVSKHSYSISHSTYSLESSFRRKPSLSYSEKEKQKTSLKSSHCCHSGLHSQIYTMETGSACKRIHASNASRNRSKHIRLNRCKSQNVCWTFVLPEEPALGAAIPQIFLNKRGDRNRNVVNQSLDSEERDWKPA